MIQEAYNGLAGISQDMPWDARAIAGTHSAITGVLAGFALAALFLLLERGQDPDPVRESKQEQNKQAMLLLFVAFVLGSLASYVFSGLVGESYEQAYRSSAFPGAMFAILALVLLSGLVVVLTGLEEKEASQLARWTVYMVTSLAVLRIWEDQRTQALTWGQSSHVENALHVILALTLVASLAVWSWSRRYGSPPTLRSIRTYSLFTVVTGLCLVGFQGAASTNVPGIRSLFQGGWVTVAVFLCVSAVAIWTIYVVSEHRATHEQKTNLSSEGATAASDNENQAGCSASEASELVHGEQ